MYLNCVAVWYSRFYKPWVLKGKFRILTYYLLIYYPFTSVLSNVCLNCFFKICLQDFVTRAKLGVQHMVQKVGFFGILACASVSVFIGGCL